MQSDSQCAPSQARVQCVSQAPPISPGMITRRGVIAGERVGMTELPRHLVPRTKQENAVLPERAVFARVRVCG